MCIRDRSTRLQLMYRNAQRLLHLVNQLLDFRKGEMSTHQSVSYTHLITASNIIGKRGFSQIPNNQIILSNGVLKQNVGWY